MKTMTTFLKGAILAGGLAYAGAAYAEEAPSSAPASDDAQVLSADDMDALSGGTGVDVVSITDQTLDAVNSGNSVNGVTVGSGGVDIGSNAFSGYSGLGNFVINTGHNNNLQSSMSVSVVLGPPTEPQ